MFVKHGMILQQISVQKPILYGFENPFFANGFLVVEIGDRVGDFEDFCVSVRGRFLIFGVLPTVVEK